MQMSFIQEKKEMQKQVEELCKLEKISQFYHYKAK